MRDYKELVKSLRICADSADPISECCCSDCCEHDEPIDPLCMRMLIHEAADAIEQMQKTILRLGSEFELTMQKTILLLENELRSNIPPKEETE